MPILYKDKHKVLFAHIPKTAGMSLYAWFYENNWSIRNLEVNSNGFKELFKSKYGIKNIIIEGEQEKNVPPQHATSATYIKWGKFTSGFTIVRNPLDRFISEVGYYYSVLQKQNKIIDTGKKCALLYTENFINVIFEEYQINNAIRYNHIRPQTDFISDVTEIIYFENDWISKISDTYKLKGSPPHLNKRHKKYDFSHFISSAQEEKIKKFYNKDYLYLKYKDS